MKIWLVNPFDPLPGGPEQLGRYAYLARALVARGHRVTWWNSRFSHRFKRPIDESAAQRGAAQAGFTLRLLDAPPYQKNVSFARLRNHRVLGRAFRTASEQIAAPDRPDLILASSPPLELAEHAAALGRQWGVPTLIDIQDQWPDNFVRVLPRAARPFGRLLLAPYFAIERRAYAAATGIIGVAEGYVARGLAVGGAKRWSGSFPLGVDLPDVDAAMRRGRERFGEKWSKPPGEIRLLYSGSLSHNYDFLTCIRAAIPTLREFGERVRFVITGQGELAEAARRIVAQEQLRNVTLAGFVEFEEYACILSQADAGFNACFPDALIYLPNKIFYYWAAGAAVLNTIPGECAAIVAGADLATQRTPGGGAPTPCGLTYAAGDADACFAAIRELAHDPARLRAYGVASRRLAETVFDRHLVYARLVEFIEHVAD